MPMDGVSSSAPFALTRMPLDLPPTCASFLCSTRARHQIFAQSLPTYKYRCLVDSYCTASCVTLDAFSNGFGIKYSDKRSCKLRTVSSRFERDAFSQEWISDLELEILQFMEVSETPLLFPSRTELTRAGRDDLVDAILREGGWLAAGWDSESSAIVEENMHKEAFRNNVQHTQEEASDGQENFAKHVELVSPMGQANSNTLILNKNLKPTKEEIRSGWVRVADLFGLRMPAKKPGHGRKLSVDSNENCGDVLSRQATSKRIYPIKSSQLIENTVEDEIEASNADGELSLLGSQRNDSREKFHPVLWSHRKKRKRMKMPKDEMADVIIERSVHRINEQIDKRNEWLSKVKLRAYKDSCESGRDENDIASISHRIQVLEAELGTTLSMLRHGRHAFAQDIKAGESMDSESEEKGLLSKCEKINNAQSTSTEDKHFFHEIEEASDELEFRETELLRKHRELREARAKLIASKSKFGFELTELRKNIKEKDKDLERAMNILKTMRTTRIVWPNPASEVFLSGSFDGWSSQRKMEKSNAGVFVTSLQLYPGRYEIKFIVNGEWKVDPNRPTTNESGHVNNVLIVI